MTLANRIFLAAILSIAAFLLFYNLDNQYLWQDEAETAVLARNISKFGMPQASDGKNTVLLLEIPEFSKNYLFGKYWMGQPWLAIYMACLSFSLFGVSTFTARLPFALTGLLSIVLIYLLGRKLFKERAISNISVALATFSVPFILHLRQCRYYSPGIFLSLLSLHLYLSYLENRRFSMPFLLASLFLLLNTSISFFLGIALAILINMFLSVDRALSKRNIIFLAALFLFSIPILVLFKLPRRLALNVGWISHNIRFYIRAINRYIFPWRSLIIAYIAYIFAKRKLRVYIPKNDQGSIFILILFIFSSLAFLFFINMNSLRYIVHISPLFFILEGYILYRLMKRFRYAVLCLIIPLAVLTNIFSFSFPVRAYLFDYIYEITHDYDGPAEGITKFLNANAEQSDTVKVIHRFDNPIIFYTDLKVDNIPPFERGTFPEWIVPSSYWNSGFYDSDYYKEVRKRYDEIILPYPDIPWENRPDDMGYHKFRTDTSAPKVRIYKRR